MAEKKSSCSCGCVVQKSPCSCGCAGQIQAGAPREKQETEKEANSSPKK
jgi:hypothetical protein